MSDAPRILLIEDDAAIRKFLHASLTSQGYQYEEAVTGEAGLRMAAYQPPDIIILDLGLPDVDGLEIISRLREWTALSIVVLTARDQEQTKIIALDAGADDYVTKPFNMGELLARIRTALRHAQALGEDAPRQIIEIGDIRADLAARRVFKGDDELQLTPIEYRLLTILMRHAGRVLTHGYLLKELWGPGYADQVHTLRVHAANLRRKIEINSAQPQYLLTERGVGYRFCEQKRPENLGQEDQEAREAHLSRIVSMHRGCFLTRGNNGPFKTRNVILPPLGAPCTCPSPLWSGLDVTECVWTTGPILPALIYQPRARLRAKHVRLTCV